MRPLKIAVFLLLLLAGGTAGGRAEDFNPARLMLLKLFGNDPITAEYSGDFNYAANLGTTSVSVGQDNTTTILTTANTTVNVGQQFFLTATVTANSPGTGAFRRRLRPFGLDPEAWTSR